MDISENDLDDLILHNEHTCVLEIRMPDGSDRAYTGRGIAAFAQNQGKRNHPFRITDTNGRLVYGRDSQGVVTIGNAEELIFDMRREKSTRAQAPVHQTRNAVRQRSQTLQAAQ